jgi:hypothetical protein
VEPFFLHMQQFMAAIQQTQQLGVTRLGEALDESARLGKATLAMWADLSRVDFSRALGAWRQGVEGWTPPSAS